nr:PREDICTED: triokinase/FMN cyclase-like [Bemisia tabaci]
MACKKLVNDPENCVDEMLEGVIALYPALSLIRKERIIFHSKIRKGRVALVAGGGSGHEPFAAGYVGEGMLTAAVAGSIFASPPSSNIFHALKVVAELNGNAGILLVVPNYTGDRLNFGLAAEEAACLNIKVKTIHVGEDCALLSNGTEGFGCGRGLCGNLFVFKIAGEMAAQNNNLEYIYKVSEKVRQSMATFGVCLKPCSLPGQEILFQLADDEIELGLGIHGEAGVSKQKFTTASEIVQLILDKLCSCLSLTKGSKVCVLINNLGGTTQLEMGIVASNVKSQLGERGITVHRMYAGALMTSLEMCGVQVCLLKIHENPEWLVYLDVPTDAPAWPGSPSSEPSFSAASAVPSGCSKESLPSGSNVHLKFDEPTVSIFTSCLRNVAGSLINESSKLNDLDSVCGDGDCGSTLHRFATEIHQALEQHILKLESPIMCLHQLAKIAVEKMGGTSGAVYGLFLRGIASSLRGTSASDWASAWKSGIDCILKYSSARLGDRTLLDVLIPACEVFEDSLETSDSIKVVLQRVIDEANIACEKTSKMKARAGRASYVNAAYVSDVDAGAYGVTVILQAIKESIS